MEFQNKEIAISAPIPPCQDEEYQEDAWGVQNCGDSFQKITINRPKVTGSLVKLKMKYCGICHTDVHFTLNHIGGTMYPIVPGHELVGVVTEVGSDVTRVSVGSLVAVGCTVDCCMQCDMCDAGEDNYCQNGGMTGTYNSTKKHGHMGGNQDTQTLGGYSKSQVVHERFIVILPEGIDLAKAAPLVCAGITMFDPLRHWGAADTDKKMNIGIAGVGGLGTMGIKLAKAMGHNVVAISSSDSKRQLAEEKGASGFVATSDPKSVNEHSNSLDLILNTIPAPHDVMSLVGLLRTNGTLVQLGVVAVPAPINQFALMMGRKSIAGSLIGGMKALQECVDFCFKHDIYPDIEIVDAGEIERVYLALEKSNSSGIRYVLDIENST